MIGRKVHTPTAGGHLPGRGSSYADILSAAMGHREQTKMALIAEVSYVDCSGDNSRLSDFTTRGYHDKSFSPHDKEQAGGAIQQRKQVLELNCNTLGNFGP